MRRREFPIADGERSISASTLARAPRTTQLEAMRTWFYEHYQDPAESCPYESAEGGYQYVWGGPYDPKDELYTEFGDIISEAVIDELANELCGVAPEWAGDPDDELDEYELAAITQSSKPQGDFETSMITTEQLLRIKADTREAQVLRRLLYVNVISAIETYLAAVFVGRVLDAPEALHKFVKTYPTFQQEKVKLSDVLTTAAQIKARVRSELLDTVWHRLDPVRHMFENSLDVNFPRDMKALHRAVAVRHDIVHRQGSTPKGKAHTITAAQVRELIKLAREFVGQLEEQLIDGPEEGDY